MKAPTFIIGCFYEGIDRGFLRSRSAAGMVELLRVVLAPFEDANHEARGGAT
jgi:hypothetical protein